MPSKVFFLIKIRHHAQCWLISLKRKMMNCLHSVPFSSRASSPTASGIREGHHHGSQETEKQNKEAESPFHKKEQSLLRRAIRILLMLFIILGIIVIFMIASQYVYLDWNRILRSLSLNKCMNGFVKLRFVGMYNPPIWTDSAFSTQ